MTSVVVERVSRTFPGEVPVQALSDVDITIGSGDYVAFVGPSGSGKSTLLNIIGLLDRPTQGTIRLDDVEVRDAGDRERSRLRAERIGFVFQGFHLIGHRTAVENVRMGLLYGGPTSPRRRDEIARSLLGKVGLGDRASARPDQMSGGEQQRVAIARALAGSPRLLLCDETTGNLDAANTESVLDLLDEIRESEGITIVVATHDPLVSARARRTIRILDGRSFEESF